MRQTTYGVQVLDRTSARTCARDSPAVQVDGLSIWPLLRIRDVHEKGVGSLGFILWRRFQHGSDIFLVRITPGFVYRCVLGLGCDFLRRARLERCPLCLRNASDEYEGWVD